MSVSHTKYRHVLPDAKGHYAAYVFNHEPFAMIVPLVDRVLVQRDITDEEGNVTQKDMIVGTIIAETEYRLADEVRNPKTTKFMGYVDSLWIQAKGSTVPAYEEQLKEYGRTWQSRTAPKIIPAAFDELFGDVIEDDEEEETPPPPRRRKGRNG